jgi:hypothetical protein
MFSIPFALFKIKSKEALHFVHTNNLKHNAWSKDGNCWLFTAISFNAWCLGLFGSHNKKDPLPK